MCEQWPIFPPPYWRKNRHPSATRIPLNGLHKQTKKHPPNSWDTATTRGEVGRAHCRGFCAGCFTLCMTLRGPLGSCMAQCGPNRDLCRVRTVRLVGKRWGGAILGICAMSKMQSLIVHVLDCALSKAQNVQLIAMVGELMWATPSGSRSS